MTPESQSAGVFKRKLEIDERRLKQDLRLAIRDVYDAIVELVTNADDRYQLLRTKGRIEIELGRRGRGQTSILRVRDFADGMTRDQMDRKLGRVGGRVSGMESGHAVRGTNSRGAKDVAALGRVTFESIAREDGRLHRCSINDLDFELEDSRKTTRDARKRLAIHSGSGTVVTIEVKPEHNIPVRKTLVRQVGSLVRLRDIIRQKNTSIVIRDPKKGKKHTVTLPLPAGKERVARTFTVPGYPGKRAKITIFRTHKKFERGNDRFRLGGIFVKSRHAIHETTLFERALEFDANALWFHGHLKCPAIDDLWNEYDDREERNEAHPKDNPVPILDPSRKSGLTRDHPFVVALYSKALQFLRPLVEEERKREQRQRSRVESQKTRRRLDDLGKLVNQFWDDFSDENALDAARDPRGRETGSRFQIRGYTLSPPFAQIVKGHSRNCWLTVRQQVFPEITVGDRVKIDCLTADLKADKVYAPLMPHPSQQSVLRAVWSVQGVNVTVATGLRACVGPIVAESTIAVLASEADKYDDVKSLQFERKRYRIRVNSRKRVKLFAPFTLIDSAGRNFDLEFDEYDYQIAGPRELISRPKLGIAVAELRVKPRHNKAAPAKLVARVGDEKAAAKILAVPPQGAGITIRLEDVDYDTHRYRWNKNVLEIAARHPSLARYLGDKSEHFPGQDERHFRVLLAEIVAEATCSRRLTQNIVANPVDYERSTWQDYHHRFSAFMSEFLPRAHALMVPDTRPLG